MIETAKKYVLAFPPERGQEVSGALSQSGAFEMIEGQGANLWGAELGQKIQSLEYQIASLDFAIDFTAPLVPSESFWSKIIKPKKRLGADIMQKFNVEKQEQLLKRVKRLEKIKRRFDILNRTEKEGQQKLDILNKFAGLNFVPQETDYTSSWVVSLLLPALKALEETAQRDGFYFRVLRESGTKTVVLLVFLKENSDQMKGHLKTLKAELLDYPFTHAPLAERFGILSRLEEIVKEKQSLESERRILSRLANDFKIGRDILAVQKLEAEVRRSAVAQGFLHYIIFWSYESDRQELIRRLEGQNVYFAPLDNAPGEEAPVRLNNNKWIRPFQYVTEIYGMPRSNEVDPTPYLAFFFILFFGICLTDAGYGLIMIIATVFPLLFLKHVAKDNKLLALMFYGGISTLVMGALFGSYFGAPLSLLEKFPWLLKLKVIDPIEDTVLFMGIAFALGYLQVSFAQIVKMISGRRNNNPEMFRSGAAWLFFYVVLVLAVGSIFYPALQPSSQAILAIAALLLVWVEAGAVSLVLKPLIGFIKVLQGLIGTLSDVLSYSRLVALGLATAVIAMIVNKIAFLLGGMIPVVGGVATVLILLGGHIFNLGINALGAFIHSGRLQFVEFFPKFLEGGGRRFKPAKADLKYLEIN